MPAGNLTRLESYPFDSNPPSTYDDYGRPVYDRAVGARMLRYTYEQFFSDGVFGTPANALQIGKASAGLAVTIQPGMFIINGSIGAVVGEPLTLQLASSAPQGVVKYAVMLRYDNNQAYRSLYFHVVAGEAGGDAPTPETGTPEVKEYRLGYVTVPSGSADMSAATVTNEKGTVTCPYSAPFEEIDLSEIVADAQNQADAALDQYLDYVKEYYDLVLSAVDGTTAGHLQEQIDELKSSGGIADAIDPNYLAYQDPDGDLVNKVGIVENAVGTRELKNAAVTEQKLSDLSVSDMKLSYKIQQLLGIMSTEGWEYEQYVDYLNGLATVTEKEVFINSHVTQQVFQSWSISDEIAFINASPASTQLKLAGYIQWESLDIETMLSTTKQLPATAQPAVVGKTWVINCGSYGVNKFKVIGVNHDNMVSGGKALITMEATKAFIRMQAVTSRDQYNGEYNKWPLYATLEDLYTQIEESCKSKIVQVTKQSVVYTSGVKSVLKTYQVHAFTMTDIEYTGTRGVSMSGWTDSRYQYYAQGGSYVHEAGPGDNHVQQGWMAFMRSQGSRNAGYDVNVMGFDYVNTNPRIEVIGGEIVNNHCPAFCLNI